MRITDAAENAKEFIGGKAIVETFEGIWQVIRSHHPELPNVVIITGTGSDQKKPVLKAGHHWDSRWHHDPTREVWGELFITGERLNDGGSLIVETLLHEAAHALARVRGIKDTSDEGRYHNRRFVQLAEEMGLLPCVQKKGRNGFNDCKISPATIERYAEVIAELDAANLPYLTLPGEAPGSRRTTTPGDDEDQEDEEPHRRQGKRVPMVCKCEGRRIPISYAQFEFGPLICGVCTKTMWLEE